MADNFIEVFDKKDFRQWLSKNHESEKKVGLIIYKKHTGKKSPSHKELMCEAICFGWIDTTVKRLDQERYIRFFCRRSKNSRWSYITLGYARELMMTKQMSPVGIEFYKEGLRKIPHDHDVPKDPKPSKEFLRELNKNKKAKENFKI
ncbi:MAG: hypothetical protein Q8P81_00450, partial [Nanoarchaeota archaeon]|nr:hypothetical protein [Nanoarchaeota archaeon]